MMKRSFMALAAIICAVFGLYAQVTVDPTPLQEDSQNVVVYFHADQGNKGLLNQPASSPVYAHVGVITNLSSGDTDWKHAPTWLDNSEKYQLEYVSANLWKLNIGDIRTYFNITDESETVKKLAFVFRDATGKKECKTESGSDILFDVLGPGLQVQLTSNLEGNTVTSSNPTVNFTLHSTHPSLLTLSVDGNVFATSEAGATTLEGSYTFSEPGTYTVTGSAKEGDEVKETKMTIMSAKGSEPKEYPGGVPRMGAVRQENGDVIFCLAAPGKSGVVLVGSWNDYVIDPTNTMYYQDYEGQRYFWQPVSGLNSEDQYIYYYFVDSKQKVGDPYAKLVLDPYNDRYISSSVYPDMPAYPAAVKDKVLLAVYQENINDYDWKVTDFKRVPGDQLIIYEMLFRDFTGTEGRASGNGTVRAAIEKIPYLKDLGVNAVELMPIMEFNGNNSWGYNTNFYFAPDKAYGTPDDYKEFIDVCHENGIAVILDIVFNQSDGLHPWYQMYPISSNPFYNAVAPHDYSVLNDWNQGHPLVRQQWKDAVKYWVTEYNVDGYRFDLVKGLGDNDSYGAGTEAYNASRVANMRAIQEAMEEIAPDLYFINEHLAGAKEENEMGAFGMMNWSNMNYASCQYAMGYQSGANLNSFYAPLGGRTRGTTVSYMESHDEERLVYKQRKYGVATVKNDNALAMQRAGSVAAQLLMSPGAHMIWQFAEIGNYDSTKSSDGGNNTSPKTVRWKLLEDELHAGLHNTFRELIHIRNNNLELFGEDAEIKYSCTGWAKGRSISLVKDDKELYTLVNPKIDGEDIEIKVNFGIPSNSAYSIVSKSHNSNPSFNAETGIVTVPANCYVTIASANLSAVEGVEIENGSLMAYGTRGALVVTAADSDVTVYSVAGAAVASMTSDGGRVELPAGVYVVVSGNESCKVAVK